jgi:alkaline phosphatase D
MKQFTRRDFVAALAAAGLASPALAYGLTGRPAGREPAFLHGVASGDPLHDRVILWTRVTPARLNGAVAVQWRIARDRGLRNPIAAGAAVTDPRRDYTVKVDATGLEPGRTYYYGFRCEGVDSPVGRTRTLPVGDATAVRFAFVSCSNFPYGYFNAYRRIAERHDLDFVLHLGDYIYEYAAGQYSSADPQVAAARAVSPANEIVSLLDYRLRHALYRTDPDLQEAHRQHPFICVWDDHESANDAWRDGAENHDPELGEGEWSVRRRNAVRAYNEWLPIRDRGPGDDRIWRRFRAGDLVDLMMLDTRLHGRDLQAAFKGGVPVLPVNDPTIADPGRTLLGFDQEDWLYEQLIDSRQRGTRWRILGQQVMMAQLSPSYGTSILNPDQWDGYAPARERLFATIRDNGIDNVVVTAGDIHSAWCSDLTSNPWSEAYGANGAGVVAVEFVTPAVSSPGPIPDPQMAAGQAQQLQAISPHMKYVDLWRRGYVLLDVTHERVQGEVWHVPTIDARAAGEVLSAAYVNEAGRNFLQPAAGASAARAAPPPAP